MAGRKSFVSNTGIFISFFQHIKVFSRNYLAIYQFRGTFVFVLGGFVSDACTVDGIPVLNTTSRHVQHGISGCYTHAFRKRAHKRDDSRRTCHYRRLIALHGKYLSAGRDNLAERACLYGFYFHSCRLRFLRSQYNLSRSSVCGFFLMCFFLVSVGVLLSSPTRSQCQQGKGSHP